MLFSLTNIAAWSGRPSVAVVGLSLATLVEACGVPESRAEADGSATDAGEDRDAPEVDTRADGGDVGTADQDGDAGVPHPCATAIDKSMLDMAIGSVDPAAGEADYYRLSLAAGETALIYARTMDDLGSLVDPVLTLFDEDGAVELATDAEVSAVFWPNGYPESIDGIVGELRSAGNWSALAYRPVADTTVCIRVEDRSTWLDTLRTDQPLLNYYLSIEYVEVFAEQGSMCLDTEPNDTTETAQRADDCMNPPSAFGTRELFLAGMLDTQDDVDVVRIPVSDDTGLVDLAFNLPGPGGSGVEGNGSTLQLGRVDLTDEAGNVYARADATLGVKELYAHVPTGHDAWLRIRRAPGSSVGANDFYYLSGGDTVPDLLNRFGEQETVAGENDTRATAETGTPGLDSIFGFVEWVATGFLQETAPGAPVDVDYWALKGHPGGRLELRCWSARIGSGVVDAEFAIVDSQGHVLREGLETKDRDFAWRDDPLAVAPPLELPDDDTYYLRVTAAGQDPDVSSRVYVCAVDCLLP